MTDEERIRASGFRQGSIVDVADFVAEVGLTEVFPPSAKVAVLVSQDCDIVADVAVEPSVEVIAADLLFEPNVALLSGRNPRRLCLPLQDGIGYLVVDVRCRLQISKSALSNVEARRDLVVGRGQVRLLAQWLGKRYTRDAFPDAFNGRWKAAQKKLERLSKSNEAASISGVFAMLDYPNDELPDGVPYNLVLWFACPVKVYESNAGRRDAKVFEAKFVDLMKKCTGINVSPESEVRSHEDISLSDLEEMKRFDWDYRSDVGT